jgi:glyoxylase-like metal-dependent hydrolase (beta-lactamase superfamily II)
MRPKRALPIACFLLLLAATACIAGTAVPERVAGLPLHIQKLDENAIRLWIGDHISSTAVVAVATSEGIIVIDTTGFPAVDAELRRIIAREFGRDDFKALINTHEHGDHTGGNAVYADCTIVGHELVAAAMAPSGEQEQRVVDWLTQRMTELEASLADLPADAPEAVRIREDLTLKRLMLEAARTPSAPVPPTRTFADRLDLVFGDTTFELFYIGGMHSSSDIAILVPEHGLLMTGDTMADVWLTDTPGCLASFAARNGVRHDFPLLLENWQALLARRDDIRTLLPGHWNGELSFDGFAARVHYIEALWAGVQEMADAGQGLEDCLAEYRLETRFPELADSPGCNQANNGTTIAEMWAVTTDQTSAAQALYDLLEAGAPQDEIRQLVARRGTAESRHFFLESQINVYGYRLLQTDRPDAAVVMFEINAELYPDSWNVYDSLGEGLLATGDRDGAIAMYEKSLALNPENANGTTMLERIRSESAVN